MFYTLVLQAVPSSVTLTPVAVNASEGGYSLKGIMLPTQPLPPEQVKSVQIKSSLRNALGRVFFVLGVGSEPRHRNRGIQETTQAQKSKVRESGGDHILQVCLLWIFLWQGNLFTKKTPL